MAVSIRALDFLNGIVQTRGAGYFALADPDALSDIQVCQLAEEAQEAGVDAFLVGGSLLMRDRLDQVVLQLKQRSELPVILFPGGSNQLSPHADAILFLSLISGRNPDLLIGEHVRAAPIIRQYGLDTVATGYVVVESGSYSSVQFMSGSFPIPRDKPDIAVAHALAAQYLGMHTLYLEGGSGAKLPVPNKMIQAARAHIELPIIVGGGIHKPETAAAKVRAGANFIVTGTALEKNARQTTLLKEIADAIRQAATPKEKENGSDGRLDSIKARRIAVEP